MADGAAAAGSDGTAQKTVHRSKRQAARHRLRRATQRLQAKRAVSGAMKETALAAGLTLTELLDLPSLDPHLNPLRPRPLVRPPSGPPGAAVC